MLGNSRHIFCFNVDILIIYYIFIYNKWGILIPPESILYNNFLKTAFLCLSQKYLDT